MKRKRLIVVIVLTLFAPHKLTPANCAWTAVPANINFGTYSVFGGSNLDAPSSYTVNVLTGIAATVKLSTGSSLSYSQRLAPRPTTPAANLNYNLYTAGARTIIWGDGSTPTAFPTYNGAAGSNSFSATIYGRVPPSQDVRAGTYTDTINATLSCTAVNDTRSFTVTTTVSTDCTATTSQMDFGLYDPVVVNNTAYLFGTGTVNVYCTQGTPVTVSLDAGLHFLTYRRMLSGVSNFLQYQVLREATYTTIWNTSNLDSGTSTSKNTPINGGFISYGRVLPGQNVPNGVYYDTLLATVNY